MDVLVDPSADLAALARDTGFANHSHLTTAFHRQFGLTPSAARAELAA
jgi:transcriptional regulator GlxA family with amidase domain